MACAYVGTTLMPPLFGVLSSVLGIGLFAWYLLFFTLLMLFVSERLNRKLLRRDAAAAGDGPERRES